MRKENDIIEEYIKFTMNKLAITRIKDTSKDLDIKITKGVIFYFLTCVSIVYVIFMFIFGFSQYQDMLDSYNFGSLMVILAGMFLFLFILIGVTIYEGKKRRFKVSYINEDQFKINNKIFDIKAHKCGINVHKKYETYEDSNGFPHTTFNYYITISQDKSKREWMITDKSAEEFRDFIYNFDYEISEEKAKMLQQLYDMQKEKYEKTLK